MNEYVPDEGELLEAWIIAHSEPGWGGPVDIGGQPRERIAEGKRALARVKRDAAREALTLYVDELVDGLEVEQLERFRDQNYPEEPQ